MAIKVVNSRYPGFIFDGENSRDYGVYITDVEVFGAPKRNVEMVTIPGRNGSYALDKGSFENVSVKYECALGAGTEEDFNNGISDFRNWLASKVGYKVLSDEINLGEYRKAVFLEGMEVPTLNKKTGTFDIVFDCMPQRWLDDASALPVEMASGDDIFNPTLFDASPLLSVWGYGDINLNDKTISINDDVIGETKIANSVPPSHFARVSTTFEVGKLATGNNVTTTCTVLGGISVLYRQQEISQISTITATVTSGTATVEGTISADSKYGNTEIKVPLSYSYGTSNTQTITVETTVTGIAWGIGTFTDTYTYSVQISYDGSATITTRLTAGGSAGNTGTAVGSATIAFDEVYGYSTKSALGEPLYFDMEIGEAYKEEDGEIISVNNAVSFPAKLPTLKPGHNAITFDNTVDKLVITPRWWKV